MSRKVYDVRVYPRVPSGFDIILRVRGGVMKAGSYPTMEAALEAAHATEGKPPAAPVYVYPRSFSALLADAVAPAFNTTEGGAE